MKLSIIIPVYNEEKTIEAALRKVAAETVAPWEKEIIVVDDGSADNSKSIVSAFANASANKENFKIISHDKNRGKGAALRTGIEAATGDAVIVQDADLEYDPADFPRLLSELRDASIAAVYGSRNISPRRRGYPHYVLGVAILSWFTNLLYRSRLTDVYTCYKLIRTDVLRSLRTESDGFEWEAEVTAKLLRAGYRIVEIPVSYAPRTFREGKKIRFRDAVIGFWTLFIYRFGRN